MRRVFTRSHGATELWTGAIKSDLRVLRGDSSRCRSRAVSLSLIRTSTWWKSSPCARVASLVAALQGNAASGLNKTDARKWARCARGTADADAEGAHSMPAHASTLPATLAGPAGMHSMAHLIPRRSSATHQQLSWSSRVASQDELGAHHASSCYSEMYAPGSPQALAACATSGHVCCVAHAGARATACPRCRRRSASTTGCVCDDVDV